MNKLPLLNYIFGVFALTVLLPTYSLAANVNAKYTEKLKVIDSRKKTVGFIESNSNMNFVSGKYHFSVAIADDGFRNLNQEILDLYYEDQDCSGSPLFKSSWLSSNSWTTDVLLVSNSNGYFVFAADTTIAAALPGSVVQGVKQAWGGCNPISSYPGLVSNSDSFYRSKNIATLPYIPPFYLK